MRRMKFLWILLAGMLAGYGSTCTTPTGTSTGGDGGDGGGGGGGGGGGEDTTVVLKWTQLNTPPLGMRQNHIAAAANGLVFVGMGRSDAGFWNDWWAFDPQTGTWTQKASFPESPREFPFVFVINGMIYVGGGRDPYGQPLKDVYRYDPSNDTWVQVASLPSPRWGASGASDGQYGYVLGGNLGSSDYGPYTDELLRYDPSTDTWEVLDHVPGGALWIPFLAYLNGSLYAGGGVQTNGMCSSAFLRYDIATHTWHPAAELPATLYDGWAIAAGGRIFVLGGHASCPPNRCSAIFFVYDPTSDSWDFLPTFPGGGRNNLIGAAVGDTLFVGLGNDCTSYVQDWWKLAPTTP